MKERVSGDRNLPIFEYECKYCEVKREVERKPDGPQPRKCRECGKMGMERVWGSVGIVFKGGGWPGEEIKKGNSGA